MENPFRQEYYKNIPDEKIEQVYRNPRLKLPFDPKDLVMFLDRGAEGTPEDKARRLRTIPYHHRSADLGITTPINEYFPTKDGKPGVHHVYTQFDIKGSGFVHPEEHESKKHGLIAGELAGSSEAVFVPESVETPMGYDILGLLDAGMIQTTIEKSRYLAAKGMRTEAVAGVYGIDVIRMDGKDISVKEFKKEAILILQEQLKELVRGEHDTEIETIKEKIKGLKSEDGFRPAIEVRCMRSVLRLRDLKDAPAELRLELIREAVKSLNIEMQYLGLDKKFTAETAEGRKEWIEFISYWIGKDVGIMHGQGLVHLFLHMGNLTLAGEVVDLDSVEPVLRKGKGEGREYKDNPYYKRVGDGYVCVNVGTEEFRIPHTGYGLPVCLVKDLRDSCFSIRMLLKNMPELKSEVSLKVISDKITQGYLDGLGDENVFEDINITKERLSMVMKEISEKVIERNEKFESFQKKLTESTK
ncbi:MAG: hypothetical protein P1P90_03470 [Patescibacteria group bacterium]|nr:hypothetical protein [Patescibacteria group bacterium]